LVPVIIWGNSVYLLKQPGKVEWIAEPKFERYFFGSFFGEIEQVTGVLHFQVQKISDRRPGGYFPETHGGGAITIGANSSTLPVNNITPANPGTIIA